MLDQYVLHKNLHLAPPVRATQIVMKTGAHPPLVAVQFV
ncbi:hypothetical protein Pmgp_02770 [Pelotomaculum propionicicum]|uniref:Uncharacterized protein n=1 Tax=Pelotomaculum propionicicum TaxID=258475 RepID=A0A4Y7RNS9_9FIRM|nr:hypothetical protein Pmgp_02770 [Pelotomaculum propionicicum]